MKQFMLRCTLAFAVGVTASASALATFKGDRLLAGASLQSDSSDFIQSADSRFRTVLQPDCNLIVYKDARSLWATGTNGRGAHCSAVMQGDGNFVLYDGGHRPLWASNTNGRNGAFVIAQNDGNVVLYQGGRPFWASNTRVPEPASTRAAGHPVVLRPGEALFGSQNDFLRTEPVFEFRMQNDCNLVLYEANKPVWASNTNGRGNDCKAIMQTDGNLVVYLGNGQVAWASGSQGKPGASLLLQGDRNAVIYYGKTAVWATHTEFPRHNPGKTAAGSPFPGCVPDHTDHTCYAFVMICKDVYACPGLTSNLTRPTKTDTPYLCGGCTP